MPIQPLPLPILDHHPIQRIAHIFPNIFIPVLVEAEGAACVLEEEVEEAGFYAGEVRG